jgi:cell wall-associated NlpC family hydrolase
MPETTWDIQLKNSPEKAAYSLQNILARKESGVAIPTAPTNDIGGAVGRRLDIINSIGDQANVNSQQVAARRQQLAQNTAQQAAIQATAAAQNRQNNQNTSYSQNATNVAGQNTSVDSKTTGGKIVNLASTFTATPYKWGGTTAKGFDCSGLVQYVYGKMGIKMPRVSQQQATMGTKTSINNLQPGDLVAWGSSPSTATHIAIYAGNGKIWEAAHAGTNVRTRSISASESGIMGISIKR